MFIFRFFKNLRLSHQLFYGFGVMLLLMGVMLFLGWGGLYQVKRNVLNAFIGNHLVELTLRGDKIVTVIKGGNTILVHKEMEYLKKEFSENFNKLQQGLVRDDHKVLVSDGENLFKEWLSVVAFYGEKELEKESAKEIMSDQGEFAIQLIGDLYLAQLEKLYSDIYDQMNWTKIWIRLANVDEASRLNSFIQQVRSSEKDFVIKRDEVSADQLKRSLREIRILVQGIKKRLEQKMYISKANDVSSAIETYEMSFDVFKKSLEEQQKEEKKMHDIFAKLSDKIKQMNTDLLATLQDVIKKATMLMVVLGIGAVILGIFIALFITKVMNNSIQHSINQLLKTEEIIRRSSDLLSTKSTDLQSMSQQQHEMINFNFNLLKKMNEVIHENLQRADISKKKADDMMSQTMSGSKSMNELNTSMERIKSSNDEIQKMVDVMHMIKQKTD